MTAYPRGELTSILVSLAPPLTPSVSVRRQSLRMLSKRVNDAMVAFWSGVLGIMRVEEAKQFSGVIYYLPGCWLAILIAPAPLAKLAVAMLATADPVAALVGSRAPEDRGRLQASGKSLYGSVAAWAVSFAVAVAACFQFPGFLPASGVSAADRLLLSAIGATAMAITELLVPSPRRPGLDDNFFIPLVVSLALTAAARLMSLPL